MKPKELLEREICVLNTLSTLPHKIVSLHGKNDNIAEFVLHELSDEKCLNLSKVAYFIDNPDFDCFKGVAGVCRTDVYGPVCNIWSYPEDFSAHMRSASFNNKVRNFVRPSLHRSVGLDKSVTDEIAKNLEFGQYNVHATHAKHDNHVLFLYKKQNDDLSDDFVVKGLNFLLFCPIHY
jgi:hypothetical protein